MKYLDIHPPAQVQPAPEHNHFSFFFYHLPIVSVLGQLFGSPHQ